MEGPCRKLWADKMGPPVDSRPGEETASVNPSSGSHPVGTVRAMPLDSLTREIEKTQSPVRRFLNQFTVGLKEVQRCYRQDAPSIAVEPVSNQDANPGTLGTAVDWLLRFLVCPSPDLVLPMMGAARYVGPKLLAPLVDLAERLDVDPSLWTPRLKTWRSDPQDWIWESSWLDKLRELEHRHSDPVPAETGFVGPIEGSSIEPGLLARGCWALALATELFRAGPIALNGPLGRLAYPATVEDLLELAPPAAIAQLAGFRTVFEAVLLPQLAERKGRWVIGPTFTRSKLLAGADGDLAAAGLLLELKTSKNLSLALVDVLEVVGYALLDFEDRYRIDTLGVFNARYAKLATWGLQDLLAELAGQQVDVADVRADFRRLLEHQYSGPEVAPLTS